MDVDDQGNRKRATSIRVITMKARLRSLVAFAVMVLVTLFASANARAEDKVPTLPTDVPHAVREEVTVPNVPANYLSRDLGWLKFSYPPEASARVESLLRDANAIKEQLASTLGQDVLSHAEVRITPTFEGMKELAPREAPPPAYASGVAYPHLQLILISMMAPRGAEATDLDQVFRHELAHVALEDAVGGQHVPAWFNEGLAVGLAGENTMDRQTVLWNAVVTGHLLSLDALDQSFPQEAFSVGVAYAEAADMLRFMMRRSDLRRFQALIQRVHDHQTFDRAIADAYGADLRTLEFQWRRELDHRYSVIPLLAGGGILWVLVIAALGWGYVRKRQRAKAILAQWASQEALEDAIHASRMAEARQDESTHDLERAHHPSVRSTKIEHDGAWHTLH
jgi:hypothetical protein